MANFFDPYPFKAKDAVCPDDPTPPVASRIDSVRLVSQTTMNALLSVNVVPQKVYQIEYSTNLSFPKWQVFSTFTNVASTGSLKFELPNALPAGESQRFYRVKVQP